MTLSYTDESRYPLLDNGSGNSGAVANGIYALIDGGRDMLFQAGEVGIVKHCIVHLHTDGTIRKADADDSTRLSAIGITMSAITSGNWGRVRVLGWVDYDDTSKTALGATRGDILYVSSTAGELTKTKPTTANAQIFGYAKTTTAANITRIVINPQINFAKVTQLMQIPVENLAADADIADRPIFVSPTAVELVSIGILTQGAPAGVNDANTSVIMVEDDASNTIVSKTYNTGTQPPTNDYADLGALNATHKVLNAGEHLLLNITNGATADLPAFLVIIEYKLRY